VTIDIYVYDSDSKMTLLTCICRVPPYHDKKTYLLQQNYVKMTSLLNQGRSEPRYATDCRQLSVSGWQTSGCGPLSTTPGVGTPLLDGTEHCRRSSGTANDNSTTPAAAPATPASPTESFNRTGSKTCCFCWCCCCSCSWSVLWRPIVLDINYYWAHSVGP